MRRHVTVARARDTWPWHVIIMAERWRRCQPCPFPPIWLFDGADRRRNIGLSAPPPPYRRPRRPQSRTPTTLSSSHRLTNSRVCPRHPFRPSAVPPSVIGAVGERTAITVDIIRINWELAGPWHCHCHEYSDRCDVAVSVLSTSF